MADPFSLGAGIVGVISLAIQITHVVVQFGLDWKYAPHDVKAFMAELRTLRTTLSETNTSLLLNSDFTEAFQNRSSLLLSELGPNAPPTTDTKMMLKICEKELKDLLQGLGKRSKGHRVGWERMKGAFLAKNTRESVENLYRQCQVLNNMMSIDATILGATTYKDVREARKEQQEAWKEQQVWQQAESKVSLAIKDGVDQINQGEESLQRQQERQGILDWLASNDYAFQQSDIISRRQEGTGLWLLDSDQFRTWVDQSNQTLFCPGIPGAGKTISASIVVDELYSKFQNDTNIGIAYVYCNFRRQQEQKPLDLLASLLKQLIQGLPSVPQSIQRLYEQHQRKRTRSSIDEVSQALQSVVRDYSKTFIIVDALDECQVSHGGRKQFLAELFNLQAKTAANFFVTSRFIPEIEKEFDGRSTRLKISASNDDLQRYLDGHILKLPSFVSRSADLRKEIKTAIVKAVDGMFLLAQLHLDSLIGKRSPKAIRNALKKLPKGSEAYDQAYREAMERIEGQVTDSEILAKQVLSWITCAKRPLTTLELRYALGVEAGEPELDNENLPEIEDMVSVCAGLVIIDEESDIIRLIHYTTQEFFERTQRDWFPKAEADIANICISYLSFDIFGAGFCQSNEEFEIRIQSNPLYDYAARNWGYHLRDSHVHCPNVEFIRSETKVSASSQALMVRNGYRYGNYSQHVPRQMRGIHLAAWFGLTEMVGTLIEDGHDPDCKDSYGRTPLSCTVKNGQEAVVRLLIERNDVEINSKDNNGWTPLSYAAAYGREAVVRLLIERNDVEINSKDKDSKTPLSWAAAYGREAAVRLLMERNDVEINSKDNNGRTPLSYAAAYGQKAVVRLLMERNDVEINSKDKLRQTPLSRAAENGRETVVRLLVERNDVKINSKDRLGRTPLSRAAENGRETVVRLLMERNDLEINSKDEDGRTPLSYAAADGGEAVVRLLMERNDVEINSRSEDGWTPLSYAAAYGQETVVRLLTKRNDVEINSKDKLGRTPLSGAAKNGRETVVRLLMERNDVEINSKDNNGWTPLSYAAAYGQEAVVRLLVERNDVEINSKDEDGRTPLSWAAQNGQEAVVGLLVERNDVEINLKDEDDRTPLLYAAATNGNRWFTNQNQETVVELLLMKEYVDVNITDIDGRTALSWAAKKGYYTRVKLLLTKDGIDRDRRDIQGRTPLSWAAARGYDAIMTLFLTIDGVDPNIRDQYGQTPLFFAAGNGHEAAVKLLLAEDAVNQEPKDVFGRTPLSWAARKGHSHVIQLLREKYETNNIVFQDEDLDIAIPSAVDQESCISCDICLSWVPNINIHYHCGICSRGDFDICQECVACGIFCLDQSHRLTRRMFKHDNFVEILD